MTRSIVTGSAVLIAALALPGLAQAQVNPGIAKIAEFGGAMHAGARACFDYGEDELRRLKQEQKSKSVAAGMSPEDFETVFEASHAKTRARLASATPAEKQKACAQLAALGGLKR